MGSRENAYKVCTVEHLHWWYFKVHVGSQAAFMKINRSLVYVFSSIYRFEFWV